MEEKGDKIILKTKQLKAKMYEVTSPTAKGLTEYDSILDATLAAKGEADSVFQAVDWRGKRGCAVIATGEINRVLAGVPGGVSALKIAEVTGEPYALTSEYVTDRFEFEGLTDIVVGCAKGDDMVYLCFDWGTKQNLILFSTKDPADRQKCLVTQDVYLEAA